MIFSLVLTRENAPVSKKKQFRITPSLIFKKYDYKKQDKALPKTRKLPKNKFLKKETESNKIAILIR